MHVVHLILGSFNTSVKSHLLMKASLSIFNSFLNAYGTRPNKIITLISILSLFFFSTFFLFVDQRESVCWEDPRRWISIRTWRKKTTTKLNDASARIMRNRVLSCKWTKARSAQKGTPRRRRNTAGRRMDCRWAKGAWSASRSGETNGVPVFFPVSAETMSSAAAISKFVSLYVLSQWLVFEIWDFS